MRHAQALSSSAPLTLGLAAGIAAMGAILFAQPIAGQNPQPNAALNGTWQLEGSLQENQQRVQQTVEQAISTLTPDIQRLARARIAESTQVPTAITIQAAPSQIRVEFGGEGGRTFETPPGQAQNVFSHSGVRARVTQLFRPDGGIEQQFRATDGMQYNFLIPQPDGQHLNLDVLMQSPRLPSDLRFRVSYRKVR